MEKKGQNMARKSFYTRDKQEVKAITDQLEEGLKELFAKEKYKSYEASIKYFTKEEVSRQRERRFRNRR